MAKPVNIRVNRDQLYSMAAKASAGENVELIIGGAQGDDGKWAGRFAIPVRDNATPAMVKARHDNGYAYFDMDRDGNTTTLKEGDL